MFFLNYSPIAFRVGLHPFRWPLAAILAATGARSLLATMVYALLQRAMTSAASSRCLQTWLPLPSHSTPVFDICCLVTVSTHVTTAALPHVLTFDHCCLPQCVSHYRHLLPCHSVNDLTAAAVPLRIPLSTTAALPQCSQVWLLLLSDSVTVIDICCGLIRTYLFEHL
ncbi:hypothetical protein MSG28_006966 [Choristoneura fumiferana]|uniref:Uncharacterized protein n=1 Tax=Choristoneura fumiferana TaxID=7141 RepID=A0ACC0JLW3_CHOFU|nr:hypothetical protein MSG28_006966 [Choristoneura fumiferana]